MKKRKRTSPIWLIDKKELVKLIQKSFTMTEVLSYFGMQNKGGNHRTLKERLEFEKIDYSKLKNNFRRGSLKPRIPLENILVENSKFNRSNLKKRLINKGLLINKCSNCGLKPEWDNKPLVMVLDHINGIPDDNRLKNLRLLCPNCNSQTETFSGKKNKIIHKCSCGKEKQKDSKLCLSCNSKAPKLSTRKVERPSKEELRKLLWEKPTVQIAADLGVSDSAICKWAKTYQIDKPPRGYWGFKAKMSS